MNGSWQLVVQGSGLKVNGEFWFMVYGERLMVMTQDYFGFMINGSGGMIN